MPAYRKKPVVIEAVHYTGTNLEEISRHMGTSLPDNTDDLIGNPIFIETLEGTMRADVGDFIIRGVNGEFYPCKPEIFTKTYEPADTLAPDPDLDAHIGAVLAEIDAACSKWADECGTTEGGEAWAFGEAGARILALRPDALQALERVRREARVEGMRALLAVGNGAAACYPDQYGDVWGAASHAMAEFIETERGTP